MQNIMTTSACPSKNPKRSFFNPNNFFSYTQSDDNCYKKFLVEKSQEKRSKIKQSMQIISKEAKSTLFCSTFNTPTTRNSTTHTIHRVHTVVGEEGRQRKRMEKIYTHSTEQGSRKRRTRPTWKFINNLKAMYWDLHWKFFHTEKPTTNKIVLKNKLSHIWLISIITI